jgi:hypothetical protein
MIFAESIKPYEYQTALMQFRKDQPGLAWGLTYYPDGVPYYFPKLGVYCCLKRIKPGVVEITGAFRAHGNERGAAQAIVDLCRTLGYATLQLDCFSYVEHAWAAVGFHEIDRRRFKLSSAPRLWLPVYGTPEVVYMRQHLGE